MSHEEKSSTLIDLGTPPAQDVVRVTFEPENRTVEFKFVHSAVRSINGKPMSFLDVAENYGIFLDTRMRGGVCACTTCHLYVKQGANHLSEADDDEMDRVDLSPGLQLNSRLGCQAVIEAPGTYVVEIPAWNKNYVQEGKPLTAAEIAARDAIAIAEKTVKND